MQDLKQFFDYMNDINFPYLVLRNWENLPDQVELGEHSDLDLLVYDLEHWIEIFPQAERVYSSPRVQFKVPIGVTYIFVDVRHIGDSYYPKNFEQTAINGRQWNEKGFYTMHPFLHRLGLAYHAVHHKNANRYPEYLGNATVDQLLSSLKESDMGWCKPEDPTVGKFHQYFKGATAVVERKDGIVVKKPRTNNYSEYPLMENEERILSKCSSKYFPKVFKASKDFIEIEDCGEELKVENLPPDWKRQLVDILCALKLYQVEHRDIKPDNLMIIDGVIKLIDFGWARFYEDDPDTPPDCLGHPYRSSWGPDDNFAMRKVIKEFEYQEEAYANFRH